MLLAMAKPPMAERSRGRRRQLRVARVSGMAASIEPMAYIVTSCPISAWETFKPLLICGSRPAGRASVITVMNPAVARASRAPRGKRSRCGSEASSVRQDSCASFMSGHPWAKVNECTG